MTFWKIAEPGNPDRSSWSGMKRARSSINSPRRATPLSAALDDRGDERRLLHRPRQARTAAGLRLFRGRAGAALSGELADARRGLTYRSKYSEAAGAVETARIIETCSSSQALISSLGVNEWGLCMSTKSAAVHFNCPHCNALDQIIKVEAGPETITDRWVTCRNCTGALPARDGNSLIKYFLLREAARSDPRARRGSQRQRPTPEPSETKAAP